MATSVTCVWGLALWINKQNSALKTLIYMKFDEMLGRLESHEKHDNVRFQDMGNHLWELRLDNEKKFQRRNFDQENGSSKS